MNAKYPEALIREWLDARQALQSVPKHQDYTVERERLSRAEEALMAVGWKNYETEEKMRSMLVTRP